MKHKIQLSIGLVINNLLNIAALKGGSMQFILKLIITTTTLLSISAISLNAREVSIEHKISGLYVAFFNRAPDMSGLSYWTNRANIAQTNGQGASGVFKELSKGFATHPVFTSTYASLDDEAFVKAIYVNSLGREGDSEGINYWKGLLDNGMSRSDMVATFIELSLTLDLTPQNFPTLSQEELAAAQFRQNLITNKVTVAVDFVNRLGAKTNVADAQDPENDPAYKASIEILSGVTEDTATMDAAIAYLESVKDNADSIESIVTTWHDKITARDVTVERGKVYDATVVDSSIPPQTAKEKANSNVYTFATTPTYPIIVTGGWIDVNANGKKDTSDTNLDITMKSYSNVVTPVTTYIADANATIRENRLTALLNRVNAAGAAGALTKDDCLGLPSKIQNLDLTLLTNAIYKDMKEHSWDLNGYDINSIMSQFATIEGLIQSINPTDIEIAVVNNLVGAGFASYIPGSEISAETTDNNTTTAQAISSSDLAGKTVVSEYKDGVKVKNIQKTSYIFLPNNQVIAVFDLFDGSRKVARGGYNESDGNSVAIIYPAFDNGESFMPAFGISTPNGIDKITVGKSMAIYGVTAIVDNVDNGIDEATAVSTAGVTPGENGDAPMYDELHGKSLTIYNNVSSDVINQLQPSFDYIGSVRYDSNVALHCTDYGYDGILTEKTTDGVHSKTYMSKDFSNMCLEFDYTNATGNSASGSGSRKAVWYQP